MDIVIDSITGMRIRKGLNTISGTIMEIETGKGSGIWIHRRICMNGKIMADGGVMTYAAFCCTVASVQMPESSPSEAGGWIEALGKTVC